MIKKIILFSFCFLIVTSQVAHAQKEKKSKKSKRNNTESSTNSATIQTKYTAGDIEENNLFFEAQRLKVLNDNKGAIDAFEKVIAFNPKNHASMFELARLYYAKQEDEKALKNISAAIKFEPNNLWYNLVYAQILTVKENYKEAVEVYNKILELEPREQAYYYDKAGLLENTGDII
jgi:tetratricopeptide (TPR) repeat protein